MGTLYFKQHLCSLAKNLIEAKSSVDKIKAYNDYQQVSYFLRNGFASENDRNTAIQLDKRIRREYRVIAEFDQLPSSKSSSSGINASQQEIDPVISNLNEDQYGILFEVLLKEGFVQSVKDFIERVE